jgi:hypothetical protein
METTAMELDQRIQAYRMQPDEPDSRVGLTPFSDIPSTFLADAQARQAQLIPGWTPTTTVSDDFTVIPGGVGSVWTTQTTNSATITAPSVGTVRLTGSSGVARFWDAALTIPSPSAGRFYSATQFSISAIGLTAAPMLVQGYSGSFGGASMSFGMFSATAVLLGGRRNTTSVLGTRAFDASSHLVEAWFTGDGYVRFAFDGEYIVSFPWGLSFTGTPYVAPLVSNNAVMDMTDIVVMV